MLKQDETAILNTGPQLRVNYSSSDMQPNSISGSGFQNNNMQLNSIK